MLSGRATSRGGVSTMSISKTRPASTSSSGTARTKRKRERGMKRVCHRDGPRIDVHPRAGRRHGKDDAEFYRAKSI
jgi:hypothetical protein